LPRFLGFELILLYHLGHHRFRNPQFSVLCHLTSLAPHAFTPSHPHALTPLGNRQPTTNTTRPTNSRPLEGRTPSSQKQDQPTSRGRISGRLPTPYHSRACLHLCNKPVNLLSTSGRPTCATSLSSCTRHAAASTTSTPSTVARHTVAPVTMSSSAQSTLATLATSTLVALASIPRSIPIQTRVITARTLATAIGETCCLR
jgi:hypothetical protein